MRSILLVLPLLSACKPEPDPAPVDTGTPLAEAPYLLDDSPDDDVVVDQAAVEAALAEVVSLARTTTGRPALDAYMGAMTEATTDCPSWYTDASGNPYWYDSCTTEAGAGFSGYGYGLQYTDQDNGDGYLWTGPAMYAAATITTADARVFTGSGSAYALVGAGDDGSTVWYSVVSGQFTWSGAESDGTWLSGDTPGLAMWLSASGDYHGAYFDGSVPLHTDGWDVAVLEDATLGSATSGWPCPGEVEGSISVHSVDGVWYEVLFDGGWEQDPATCDQCGSVWIDGVARGSACVDASPWVDWDTSPW